MPAPDRRSGNLPASSVLARTVLTTGFVLASFLLWPTVPAAAQGARSDIFVTLDSPDPYTPAFGEVEIIAVVGADEEIERVTFYVDGVVMGELREKPYTLKVSLGDDVDQHSFQVVAYGKSGATGSGTLNTPGIQIDEEVAVRLQQFYVTATRDDHRVLDLEASDFEIQDEGHRQEIVTFARGDIPFTAMVLLDSSLGMAGEKLRAALEGARAFFDGMNSLDEGKLLVFSDRILHATPFTTFPAVLTAGLGRVRARGGTALNDHIYLGLKQLEERQGRRVVILLSDGVDSHSVLSMADALERARRSQALIYWLRLPYRGARSSDLDELPSLRSAWRSMEDYRHEYELLVQTVEESGGRVQTIADVGEISAAFRGILEELRDQYVLGYYPKNARKNARWRRVRVKVNDSSVKIRAREGYVDL
jgi:Ca-activated chloride channel homolog